MHIFKNRLSDVNQGIEDARTAARKANDLVDSLRPSADQLRDTVTQVQATVDDIAPVLRKTAKTGLLAARLGVGAAGLGLAAGGVSLYKNLKSDKQQEKLMNRRNFHYMDEMASFNFKPGTAIRTGLENTGRFIRGAARKAVQLERAVAKAADDLVQRSMKPNPLNNPPVRPAASSKSITPEVITDPEILDAIEARLRNSNRGSNSVRSMIEDQLRDAYVPPYSNIPQQLVSVPTNVPRYTKNNKRRNLAIGAGVLATGAGLGIAGKYYADRNEIED